VRVGSASKQTILKIKLAGDYSCPILLHLGVRSVEVTRMLGRLTMIKYADQ
jgi:hypothetical protein